MSGKKQEIECSGERPLFVSLQDRLRAGRDAADQAWALKTAHAFRESVATVAAVVREFEVRAPEIVDDEAALRLRYQFASTLRTAASAIEPRAV